ncbi:hypothetical protein T492DRAFT_51054 [Pavlovales sp. CCMP2436]|nr:hypothetical protein T492DRAFT_51054 [Pavlovales sp. CCMP2436]
MTGAHAHTHGDWSHIGGSPPGHTLPGVLFLVLGVHWTFAILWQLLCGRPEEASRAWYPLPMTWRRPLPSGRLPQRRGVPIEPVLKVILPSLGAAVEVYFKTFGPGRIFFRSLYNERGEFQHVGEWAHAAMYAFFILSGCADLAMEGVAACWDAGKGRARTLEANSVVEETGEECENADAKANADSGAWPGRSVARRVELAALGMAFGHTAIQLVASTPCVCTECLSPAMCRGKYRGRGPYPQHRLQRLLLNAIKNKNKQTNKQNAGWRAARCSRQPACCKVPCARRGVCVGGGRGVLNTNNTRKI